MMATGIECSAPVIAGGQRRDELLLTDHWDRYEEDFDLVRSLGIRFLRYGIPFHVVARDPDRFDWTWTDRALEALRARGIEPIADLMHFGVPDDLWGIGDPRLPARHRAFVAAFAERYPWVRWYTPVNEPFVTAWFSARMGWWNERQTTEQAFVRALDNVVTCAIGGMEEVRSRRSDAIFVQSDACERFSPSEPAAEREADLRQELGFLAFDLTYGREPDPVTRAWLARAGMPSERLAWFDRNGSRDGCIVGLDYYVGNERTVAPDGTERPAERVGFAATARPFIARYGLPVMLAETNITSDRALAWLDETWRDTALLVAEGQPIVGYCWYALTDQVDWDTCLREPNDRVNSLGLVDLQRRRRPVAAAFEALVAASTPAMPSDEPLVDLPPAWAPA